MKLFAVAVFLLGCAAYSMPPLPASSSAPQQQQPTDVRIISAPTATAPAEVRILSVPENASERALVRVTWVLVAANALLCWFTYWGSRKQSRDLRTRERATLEREANRAAHRVMATATRLEQLASEVPKAREHLHVLLHQGGMPPDVKKETEEALKERLARLRDIASARKIAEDGPGVMSDGDLIGRLWRLDEHQEQLEVMRDAITYELNKYETESLTIREQNTAMQAAALNAQMTPRPLKTTLGE